MLLSSTLISEEEPTKTVNSVNVFFKIRKREAFTKHQCSDQNTLYMHVIENKLQYVASVGSGEQHQKRRKFYSLPINDTIRFDVSSKWPFVGNKCSRRGAFARNVESYCIV